MTKIIEQTVRLNDNSGVEVERIFITAPGVGTVGYSDCRIGHVGISGIASTEATESTADVNKSEAATQVVEADSSYIEGTI